MTFQQRQNQVADFSESIGIAAGRRAYRHAKDNVGQPTSSGIYFSVDFDASSEDIRDRVAPYFKGVKQAFAEESGNTNDYRVGVYGSGLVCETLAAAGLIVLKWLAMSRGFQSTRESLVAGCYNLVQLRSARSRRSASSGWHPRACSSRSDSLDHVSGYANEGGGMP